MSERIHVVDMRVEHIEFLGNMIAAMVAEAPKNFSITPEAARAYGSGDDFFEGMIKALKENKVGRFMAITDSGECAGMATTADKGDNIRLGNMYVEPFARSQGVGNMLLQACELRALDDNYSQMTLVVGSSNTEARIFYERHDFNPLSPPERDPWELHPGIYGETLAKNL